VALGGSSDGQDADALAKLKAAIVEARRQKDKNQAAEMMAMARAGADFCPDNNPVSQQGAGDTLILAFLTSGVDAPPSDEEVAAKEKELAEARDRLGDEVFCRRYAVAMGAMRRMIDLATGRDSR
jgi:hypothetical protein